MQKKVLAKWQWCTVGKNVKNNDLGQAALVLKITSEKISVEKSTCSQKSTRAKYANYHNPFK